MITVHTQQNIISYQIKQARNGQEEWRDAYNELETMLTTETVSNRNIFFFEILLQDFTQENRQCFEVQLRDANFRQKEVHTYI